jgi:MSHA biogenesis protein MshQ
MTAKKLAVVWLNLLFCLIFSASLLADTLSSYLTGDNAFDVYISTDDNVRGTYLGSGKNWQNTYTFNQNLIKGQDYYLHIQVQDTGGIAGFIGDFTLSGSDHVFPNNQLSISTNTADWKVSKTAWKNYLAASKVNGNNGVSPWGKRPYISSGATWIWSADAQNDNEVYFSLGIVSTSAASSRGSCSAVFPNGVSSHSAKSNIDFGYNAQMLGGTNHVLATSAVSRNSGSDKKTCQSQDCQASGSPSDSMNVGDFVSKSSTTDIVIGYKGSATVGDGSNPGNIFDDINRNSASEATISFANKHPEYFVASLTLGFQNTLYLQGGSTYWFNQLLMDSQSKIIVQGSGTAIVYVNQSITFPSPGLINSPSANRSGDASKLVVYAYNDVSFNNQTTLSGSLYARGNITLGSASYAFGALAAKNTTLGTNSTVTYQESSITNTSYSDMCAGDAVVLAFYEFEEPNWSGSSSIIDSSANARHGSPIGSVSPIFPDGLQKSCQVLDVPPNSRSSDKYALDTGIDVDDDIGQQGTISFWYRSNTDWASGGARQLFDASNTGTSPDKYFYLSLNNGTLQFGLEDSNDADALLNVSNLSYAANEWVHVAVTWASGGKTMGIYLNGNQVAVTTNGGLNGQLGELTTLYIGDNRSSYLVNASTNNSANGQFDDLRIYQTAQAASEIALDATTLAPCDRSAVVLAFYEFEEDNWRGSGSILDSSSNANHGSPVGSVEPVLPIGQQKSCKVMDVGYNSSFFYTEALNTSLDVDRDIGQAGTVSFWYRSKVSWSSSSSRQLLDASNGFFFFFGKSFYLSLYSGKLEFGMEDSSDKDAVLRVSGLNFSANEWVHVAINWDLAADKMGIYINGVDVASTTKAGLNGRMADLNTLYIGDSRDLYFTGNSTDNSAYGQYDDLRIYQAAQAASEIAHDANTLSPCVTNAVDHFRLEHDTQGFTCEAESIVLKACKDANCTQLYEQPTSISLSPGTWSGANTLNFTGSINTGLSISTAGTYILSKTAASENADLRCFFGSNETCEIEFVDAGFEFIGATISDKTLPDQLAESQFSNVKLRSVQDNNGVCQAALTGSHTITLGYNCDSPAICLTSLAGIAISDASGESSGNITLNFGTDGIASLQALNYADAGRLALSAQANVDGAQILKGTALVDVYPASLGLSVSPAALVYSGPADTSKFIAGEPFELIISAYGLAGRLLPNYQAEQMQLKAQRTYPTLAGSTDGNFRYASTGELGSSTDASLFISVNNLKFSEGQYRYASAYYDEAGRIAIDAQDLNYLGNKISSLGELALGHFSPAYYWAERESPLPFLQDVQSGFSYVGQTISFSTFPAIRITAKNALDQTMYNHDSLDWTFRPTIEDVNDPLKLSYLDKSTYLGNTTVFKGNAPLLSGADNYDGSVVITLPDATIVYNKTDASQIMYTPVDPFIALVDIVFHAEFLTDGQGICFRDNYLDANCNELTFIDVGGANLRFGRFALNSVYGPETETLRPKFVVEYWDKGQWLVNTLDNGTTINFTQAANQILLSPKGNGNDLTALVDPVTSDGSLLLGLPDESKDFELSAPRRAGELYLRLNPAVDVSGWSQYLNYDWNGDGYICNQVSNCLGPKGLDYPQAIITFGQFRGNDRVIQWREVFN